MLHRRDESKPHDKENSYWGEPTRTSTAIPRGSSPDSLRSQAISAGLPYPTVYYRVQMGWTREKALSTPVRYAAKVVAPVVEADPSIPRRSTVKWGSKKPAVPILNS